MHFSLLQFITLFNILGGGQIPLPHPVYTGRNVTYNVGRPP